MVLHCIDRVINNFMKARAEFFPGDVALSTGLAPDMGKRPRIINPRDAEIIHPTRFIAATVSLPLAGGGCYTRREPVNARK